jgi:phosphatidate phosphatase APP1
VLVGDSGEKDPEIYGALARKFPSQIHRIYIRDVTAEDANAPRYRQAFDGVRREVWSIFRMPKEIEGGLAD